MLPTALFILLSALLLPDTPQPVAGKGSYIADQALSADAVQQDSLVGSDGDNQEFSVASSELALRAPAQYAAFFPTPAPAPEFPHTVSQARAPPQS